MKSLVVCIVTSLVLFIANLAAQDQPPVEGEVPSEKEASGLLTADFGGAPTFISSDSLVLQSQARLLEYQGAVEVIHGDLNLKCDVLQVVYDENNKIEELIALKNVFITKGPNIRARGEKAVYEETEETLTLTENPELQQDGSVLTADLIRIFLAEDRSVAEGEVRVKLLNKDETGPKARNN